MRQTACLVVLYLQSDSDAFAHTAHITHMHVIFNASLVILTDLCEGMRHISPLSCLPYLCGCLKAQITYVLPN